jgi:NTP pyrophosphatase (non-canonical NTP hydrolase)|nr:MAG TPA: NTP-PPase-like protein [Caudoviricetes sp.]
MVRLVFVAEPEEPTYDGIPALINKINHWADERNLKQADPKIQWMRVTEEVGEIRDVLLKPTKFTEPQAALKDAIGDTLVTIIVLAHQLDLDVTECLGIAYEEIKNRNGKDGKWNIRQRGRFIMSWQSQRFY